MNVLTDKTNQVFVSYISLMELTIKAGSGKLEYDQKGILKDISDSDIEMVMPDTNLLEKYQVYNPTNKNPFDNLIITEALVNKFTLMTADNKILRLRITGLKTINARS